MNIIGIAGVARAGKGAAAATLVAEYDFVEINFADELKRIVMRLWPLWGEEDLWGDFKEREWPEYGGLSPRKACQFVGTNVARELDPNVWVRHWDAAASAILSGGWRYLRAHGLLPDVRAHPKNVASSDTRFPNEIEAIRLRGGRIWRVERPELESKTEEWRAHKSETSLAGIEADTAIVNGGSLEQLADAVRHLMLRPINIVA